MSGALARRPRFAGLVVPYIVDEAQHPIDFKRLDTGHVDRCATGTRCGICGDKIPGPVAFIGPAEGGAQGEHGGQCYADPWMHPACAELAMQQCPFLSGRRDWRSEEGRAEPILKPYSAGMAVRIAPRGRAHRDKHGRWHFEALEAVS